MPRQTSDGGLLSSHVSRLVPTVARHACYQCGRHLLEEREKRHCRMCYDVFCLKCTSHTSLLTEYGYGSAQPQSVCDLCHGLLSAFPMLLCRVDDGRGGQMLLAQQRVWVTDAGETPDTGGSPSASSSSSQHTTHASTSNFSHQSRQGAGRSSGRLSTPATGIPAAVLAAAVNASSSTRKRGHLQAINGMPLALLSFRPVNPETVIAIGTAAQIPLRCIREVQQRQASVRIVCPNGYVDLTVGTMISEHIPRRRVAPVSPQRPPTKSTSKLVPPTATASGRSSEGDTKGTLGSSDGGEAVNPEPSQNPDSNGGFATRVKRLFSSSSPSATGTSPATPVRTPTGSRNRTGPTPPPQPVPPDPSLDDDEDFEEAERSDPSLDGVEVEFDSAGAEMLAHGLAQLVQRVRSHFHFRPDVHRMEQLASMAAHAERAGGGSR